MSSDIWIFGYGSLMWNPGFPFIESELAYLRGYHRAFCIESHRYRGTPERPGLVLGLDRGGSCRGVAFHVAAADAPGVLAIVDARELVTGVYLRRPVAIEVGEATHRRMATAWTYVTDRKHVQYVGKLELAHKARMIQGACGNSGTNRDYLDNTLCHLNELGISDPYLERLKAAVDAACP
ncbi:MAG TPA: gamma-glutamylcyclotransferase [Alphaproteobacteria bacterium]|jgi:cation transport protein ChaC